MLMRRHGWLRPLAACMAAMQDGRIGRNRVRPPCWLMLMRSMVRAIIFAPLILLFVVHPCGSGRGGSYASGLGAPVRRQRAPPVVKHRQLVAAAVPFVPCHCSDPDTIADDFLECSVLEGVTAAGDGSLSTSKMDVDGLVSIVGYLSDAEQKAVIAELEIHPFHFYAGKFAQVWALELAASDCLHFQ